MAIIVVIDQVGKSIEQGATASDFRVMFHYNVFDTVLKSSTENMAWADVTAAMTEAQIEVAVRNAAVADAQANNFAATTGGCLMPHLRKG